MFKIEIEKLTKISDDNAGNIVSLISSKYKSNIIITYDDDLYAFSDCIIEIHIESMTYIYQDIVIKNDTGLHSIHFSFDIHGSNDHVVAEGVFKDLPNNFYNLILFNILHKIKLFKLKEMNSERNF